MSQKPLGKQRIRYISLLVSQEMYDKAQRLAEAEHRSVSGMVRRLLDEQPDPGAREPEAT